MRDILDVEKRITLNQVMKELYAEKKSVDIESINTADSVYKNFVKDNKEKLEKILVGLGISLQNYKNENNKYSIPILVGEIFKIYLSVDSKIGSIVNKIKIGEIEKINLDEREKFVKDTIKILKNKYKDYIKKDVIFRELDQIESFWIQDINYYKNILIEEKNTMELLLEYIDLNIKNVSAVCGTEGLITVNDEIDKKIEYSYDNYLKVKDIKFKKHIYDLELTRDDRIELIKYLKKYILEGVHEWKTVVNEACRIREYYLCEEDIDSENFISSKKLVEEAIAEVKNGKEKDIKRRLECEMEKDNNIENIIKELGKEIKNK